MYKVLTIGGKEYRLEYSIEASLYADCVTSLMGMMADVENADNEKNVKKMLEGMSNIPQTALTIFYAGLMEAHGSHPDGDGTVPDIQTAKRLISEYMKEHKGEDSGNFYGVMNLCVEQMVEDGFFELVGLNALMESPKKKQKKVPTDHQKASRK